MKTLFLFVTCVTHVIEEKIFDDQISCNKNFNHNYIRLSNDHYKILICQGPTLMTI